VIVKAVHAESVTPAGPAPTDTTNINK
jgi:hypothetical protein